ncbi:sensor histidine kinase [Xylanivirga thermophila]|uniref:sensor histidine kinase n=1 Tax=Xylanivirga thermophila TaxID=2496273 RepID=UPI00101D2D21|nr:HAMP domain-containing sensor histidine kinase [Xylanivirga thermophila]
MKNKEINKLAREINELINQSKGLKKEYVNKDIYLKNTLTSLSHDIRTPLTSLDGYIQLLKASDDLNKKDYYTDILQDRVNVLNYMIENLFIYSKLQNHIFHLELEICDLKEILVNTIFQYYEEFQKENIDLSIKFNEDEDYYVVSNETALIRIIQNIIKNILEHARDSAVIAMAKVNNKITLEFKNQFDISDKVDPNRIFDLFYKSDSARSKSSSGIGLTVVEELVRQIKGNIKCEINGTAFSLILTFFTK